jgi:sialate O-acetylesterase
MRNIVKSIVFSILVAMMALTTKAAIKLPQLVSSHMVLQRNKPINIWGWANAGENISITFAGNIYNIKANADGKWRVKLPAMLAGGPFEMVLKGTNQLKLNDILIGDVWLCSGQSNMEFPLSIAKNADEEVSKANYPDIRLYTVNKNIGFAPAEDTQGQWSACNSETARNFSAIGYFFAREIQQRLHVPIGLINSSWGGTVIESWISADGLATEPTFGKPAQTLAQLDTAAYNATHRPAYALWIKRFQQQDAGTPNGNSAWASPALNTGDWKTVNLPLTWEFTGKDDLWEMDGIVWFRKSINLTKADIQKSVTLNLGVIQNADVTYVNGVEVGHIPEAWGKFRSYNIPPSVLKEGENLIAVKVENYGGDGGFSDPAKSFFIKTAVRTMSIAGLWQYKIGYKLTNYDRPNKEFGPNNAPALLYNSMISPLTQFSIKGILWYQGESNWFRGEQYQNLFPRMITDWRAKFKQGNLPFLYVQLANYHRKAVNPGGSYWAEIREAQSMALKLPNTGMVTAIDAGDSANIHPKNKQLIGHRLAMLAQQQVYKNGVKGEGPHYQSMQVKDNYILVHINRAINRPIPGTLLNNFQIAGVNEHFYWAKALLLNDNTIKIFAMEVPSPIAVRYAWEDNPSNVNIYSKDNLPLFPFRTDNWKLLSADNTIDK